MVDQRLVDYIRENLQRGYPVDGLVQILLNQGWSTNEINEAIDVIQGVQSPPIPPGPAPPEMASPSAPERQPSSKPKRPLGVTIICVLGWFGIVGSLITGVNYLALVMPAMNLLGFGVFLSSLIGILGIVYIALAIVNLVAYYLLFKMKRTGWIIVIITGIISIAGILIIGMDWGSSTSIMSFVIVIPLTLLIIGYLFMKRKLFVSTTTH